MQKICAIILLSALASNHEALPQTKWNRQIRNSQGQLIRERRQFPFGEWIPLSQPCPTCRPFADPLDIGFRGENVGLTPPRPPTVTRQIHGEGNFFPDESSILSVPPPPPGGTISRHPSANFQFSSFGPHFNAPLPVPQAQQIPFLPQTFVQNQQLLVNGNQQILPNLNTQGNFFGQDQHINNGKVNGFNSEFKTPKIPENVVLEQNRQVGSKQAFSNKPQPFRSSQNHHFVQPQSFNTQVFGGQQPTFGTHQQSFGGQAQTFSGQQQFGNSILTPPPAPKNVTQDIVIPGLDKEEIQLLYVPVETLRQRGTPQQQQLTQQPENVQYFNRGNGFKTTVNNARPTEPTVTQPKGHFVTQNGNGQRQTDVPVKIPSSQTFPPSDTSTLLLQNLPFHPTPQPFVSATPATPTVDPFVTPASVFQKFSSFTPETTLPHLSTNAIQFSQSDLEFGTTPKTLTTQNDIINGKSQFSGLKNTGFTQDQRRPFQQSFTNQPQTVTPEPQMNTVFSQEQQDLHTPTHFPQQIDQYQIALQKQQEQQRQLQRQRQKEVEEQRIREQQKKQKELEEQRISQQQRQKELEQQRYLQKQKELEEQRILQQQQRQKELEQQRLLQKQKELEEQRQKELEQQRYLQKQKELEQQRIAQKQKELEEQRLLQQRQKELEEQRFLQEQRQKELEAQRRQQLQRQKELEEKRRLQQKQREEEQRLLRLQQQQKEAEQQRLVQQQELQRQKQENYKKFQIFKQQHQQQQHLQQQQQQQQQLQQNIPQQSFQQANRHILPANDKLNFIPQLEKESEPEDQQLVPHQPPLSVFFKGNGGTDGRITDVLRELRSSNTITVLDQYFEKMPKVFVGPAGLIPPQGYEKFELPYLSNLESNRIERRIGKLPFFVAPLNFIPPPGYAKIPFPAPHVGSVVVSSESNPEMSLKTKEKGSADVENVLGSFPVVGPELPGLINNLDTETTTVKPTTFASTPSLPQTTAQLRGRRPNNSLYKPQSRKPITRTRTTTSKPEEEVTQPIQKVESTKDSETGVRKPFNRFVNRRRPQKTTTEAPSRSQQEGKGLENRYYPGEDKNQILRSQQKSDVIQSGADQYNRQYEQRGSIDRITPSGQGVFEVRPTPDFPKSSQTVIPEENRPEVSDYTDVNLQAYEDGPLPTGSAKTITQEFYSPNSVSQSEEEQNSKALSKSDSTVSSVKHPVSDYEDGKFSEVYPTDGLGVYDGTVSEGQVSVQPTSIIGYEKQDESSEKYDTTELARNKVSFTPGPTAAAEEHTKSFLDSNEHYTSAFAEISKPHHIPGYTDSSRRQHGKFSHDAYPTPEISVELQVPHQMQEVDTAGEVKPTQNIGGLSNKFSPTRSSAEYSTGLAKKQHSLHVTTSQVSPTVPTEEQFTSGFSVQPTDANRASEDERIGSFINLQDTHSTVESPASPHQYSPSSTTFPSLATPTGSSRVSEYPVYVEQSRPQVSSTAPPVAEVTANPSVQTYTSAAEALVHINEQTQTDEGQGQDVTNNLSNDHRLKLPNPAIVRVRTRTRSKSRGQVNFAASQTTTPAAFTRTRGEKKQNENVEQEVTTKANIHEYNPVKTSKYNQYRGVKKPARTTTEAPVETEEKTAGVYTIRPPRRPVNPSTVSTKRIRRPTSPVPTAESVTEAFGISTAGLQPQSEHSDISPSGVSNDVYYEQSSLSPVKHKFRKHFGTAEQKNDLVSGYLSTSFPATYSTAVQDEYSEESNVAAAQTEAPLENSDKYPEWNPSESGFDVSGIVLTTTRIPGQEDQSELEEPKKSQDTKKALDPDLEKKTGRRRVRVRVHKRPHENFETAESQNLRTVANVLVPPTTTYKPNDENSFQQLAKNVDFSFGGQKLFGSRSREYFRKRLNLTQSADEEQPESGAVDEGGDRKAFLKKAEKAYVDSESVSNQSSESSEGGKVGRPKFRGFVRKIIKHAGASRESEANHLPETEDNGGKHETTEFHTRQTFRSGFNHTGRVNGTRHKTFVRFVKKNKIRHHETETVESSSQEPQKEEQGFHQITESLTTVPAAEENPNSEPRTTETYVIAENKTSENQPEVRTTQTENVESEITEEPQVKETQQPLTQTTQATAVQESISQIFRESASSTQQPATQSHLTGLYLTQRPKFYQTLRPIFPRPTSSGFQRSRETESTQRSKETESTTASQEERRSGYSRYKYGKTTGSPITEKLEEAKKISEQQFKNKNLNTLEVRKYLRAKNREGAFSQFSKNKYFTSENTETTTSEEKESEEASTEKVKTSSSEPKTTQPFVSSTEAETETTGNEEESEHRVPTTEAIIASEEESSEEDTKDVTSPIKVETTTETELPTTDIHTTEKAAESKSSVQTTETVEAQRTEYEPDIYRFSENSFSFDEAEKFTGTKNRAHVRNITTDILENTASFSAPGVEKHPDVRVVTHRADEAITTGTEKTEVGTTELNRQEITTEYPETETVASTNTVTKAKVAKILKTSTTTKISHETEICYRGKCIRTKSENPDEDLKLLVDSASIMKIEKTKT